MSLNDRLKNAGKELIKGNLGNSVKSLFNDTLITSGGYTSDGGFFMMGTDGREHYFTWSNLKDSVTAYTKCPPVTAIINKKAQAYVNGKTTIVNTSGKAKDKEATSEVANSIRKLMARPNPIQSWKQFEAQAYIYKQLFGYNCILAIKPVGFKSMISASALWNIPPTLLTIRESTNQFYSVAAKDMFASIKLTYKGMVTELNLNDVYIMKDFTPSFNTILLPESRIRSLELPINNIIGAYESRNVLINYRGALGILTSDKKDESGTVSLTPDEKKAVQEDFKRYGLKKGQWQVIITSAQMKWQNMGYPTKDLMLFEEIEDDIMRVCDSYGYPYQLMSSANGTTYANVSEAKKLLYQDTIISEAESFYEQWNEFFDCANNNICIKKDYSHVAALQADKEKEANAGLSLSKALYIDFRNNVITLNQWRIAKNMEPTSDGDVYYSQVKDMIGNSPMENSNDNNNSNNNGNNNNQANN